ncbi:MAG TPA: HAD family hydrolase [Pyrinomonadaceae bacterium]|nr:HAD family hydrolase [Pyrinomonadaceae bacterium]
MSRLAHEAPRRFHQSRCLISEEVGYVDHPSRFCLFPFAGEAIRLLNDNDWLAIVVTNQSGVARGYFPEAMIHAVHNRLKDELESGGARLDAIYYCSHHPTIGHPPYRLDCDCRKPKPGLIHRALKDFDVDLSRSWVIGDRYVDVELAGNAGLRSALVMTGYGREEWEHQRNSWQTQPDILAEDLLEAVLRITKAPLRVGDAE